MIECPNCSRKYFSTKQFKTIKYNNQDLLVCPVCKKENEREKLRIQQEKEEQERRIQREKEEEERRIQIEEIIEEERRGRLGLQKNNGDGFSDILADGLRLCGILSTIICIIAGLRMVTLRSISGESVAEVYYQSVGIFVIGLSFFIGPLLFGIAYLVEKK